MLVPLKTLLLDAEKHGYAVIAPDFPTIQTASYLLQVAEINNAPLALSFSPSLKPATGIADYAQFVRIIRSLAAQVSVPIALHLDHAYDLKDIQDSIDLGFTSVMIDASAEPWDVNVARSKEVVRIAHQAGVSVESELGHVATGEKYLNNTKHKALLTDPQQAAEFVAETGIDALAVAIGTVHGSYQGEPNLDFDRLQKLNAAVEIPLVLHGSSGTGEENLRRTIDLGIRKINVYSELMNALEKNLAACLQNSGSTPMDISQAQFSAVKTVLEKYFRISGSKGAGSNFATSRQDRAKDLFLQGYTCAEAIYLAFSEQEKYASDIVQLVTSVLGGGIANQGKTCGALLGGFAVLAARHSSILPNKKESRKHAINLADDLREHFLLTMKHENCIELIGLDFKDPAHAATYKTGTAIQKTCLPAINHIVQWLENHLQERISA